MDLGLSYKDWARIAWTFGQAFVATFLAGIGGIGAFPEWWNGGKAGWAALVVAALAAALSALKNLVLADSSPLK